MPWKNDPDLWGFIGTMLIALMSGFIAVVNQLTGGQKFSIMWLAAQLIGALLAGYLMWDAHPMLYDEPWWPKYLTQPFAVAFAAHYGGKIFSLAEKVLGRKLPELKES